jgi:hypothetical protein
MTENKIKKVPVVLNRRQLAAELPASVTQVYRAVADGVIIPDFLDFKGTQLFKSQRLESIRRTLVKLEIT